MTSRRPQTLTTHLIRAGFADLTRSATLWNDAGLVAVRDGEGDESLPIGPDGRAVVLSDRAGALLARLGDTADPDLALLQLTRLAGASPDTLRKVLSDDGGPGEPADVGVQAAATPARRLLRVLGASSALGDELVRRPELLDVIADPTPGIHVPPAEVRAELLRAVDADPDAEVPVAGELAPDAAARGGAALGETGPGGSGPGGAPVGVAGAGASGADTLGLGHGRPGRHPGPPSYTDQLRRAYRARLLRILATDVTAPVATAAVPAVAAALADLAGAALEAALAVARYATPGHEAVRLTVIGMGKTGGRELNYVSDVDVIYVAEPATGPDGEPATEEDALRMGTRLATALARVCSGTSDEPRLWEVDAALRPEGKQGPLVRTLASHVAYYERWASTWEFQALLKARPVAGDRALGDAYVAALSPMVWQAASRENFVEDARAMRKRVEDNVPAAEAPRQIKLGRGGLRDVEFTVQLLQLVHGRTDESIRSATTLDALAALAAGGYVGRAETGQMTECYAFLRALEHRIQVFGLRRTHLMPTDDADLRRLARGLGMPGAEELTKRWKAVRREVRDLHEAVFYRPLLPATAGLSEDEISLAPEAAMARFAAIGYRNPAGAMRHVEALTEGVSRRAAIQRQLLPVLLGWFADGADPDAGLLAFRKLSDVLGSTHWYLRLLRDSEVAAERLAQVLSSSSYLADALARSPESVKWLGRPEALEPLGAERLSAEMDAVLGRAEEPAPAAQALRALRRRELARTGVAEVLGELGPVSAARAISDAADVVLGGALRVARAEARDASGIAAGAEPAILLVVAMGRLGGQEMGYGSDADVMFVHSPASGAGEREAGEFALAVARELRRLLSAVGPEPPLPVDADLRPEGRNGPLVRSFASYQEYYERWSSPWEAQALLRARPLGKWAPAGGASGPEAWLADRFTGLVDPLRYPAGGLPDDVVREVRRIKARVEAERLPRGADPARHLKLGRGGVSDVEWTVQLLQLQHAHEVPELRTTGTIPALYAARDAGLVSAQDATELREAWFLASRLRSAIVLWSGKTTGAQIDRLPHGSQDLAGVAGLLGDVGTGPELEELYLRTARRARAVMERLFYGEE
ncbi:bifunctional [glutamine synthetase] adenylyltransferase/[glutamine synthetase]-adenylyl-L-tyrosine phosphorylase [Myceligenerans pegani]|uniref:Bifunctional glutamine synthetase adenylyltransferase/adenylyl-removing enzyme n=1 Tax=Myceligenerans pegani TaxID=2776917 RepID=A0ABR9MXU1_9MICO|nr:bifunctional [glutamine synthetase] adenylyltransferase/[glutamine synthetase]-adenylyl-L-tyrosine phosphorylase [Myceligenerans sp. TRM 65318]MBE1876208.1 bifunctional [glutamine synthetase] adenylyltransferase/[glutamine synthetase]-adenylyl-L-tyrosine phosphorylase [Myceligenerans sp. TRM 65318]MBE3018479.1 bifunctional [glutamine synthetase] adenylyltransferase/[glutamine synthetase]-adenylyl-L-tyrosine phosphorylase [Myceligenerans sp. TRM 65318]